MPIPIDRFPIGSVDNASSAIRLVHNCFSRQPATTENTHSQNRTINLNNGRVSITWMRIATQATAITVPTAYSLVTMPRLSRISPSC